MLDERKNRKHGIFLGEIFLFALIICLLILLIYKKFDVSNFGWSDAAAWVQAVGSIGVIIYAWFEGGKSERRRHRELRHNIAAARGAVSMLMFPFIVRLNDNLKKCEDLGSDFMRTRGYLYEREFDLDFLYLAAGCKEKYFNSIDGFYVSLAEFDAEFRKISIGSNIAIVSTMIGMVEVIDILRQFDFFKGKLNHDNIFDRNWDEDLTEHFAEMQRFRNMVDRAMREYTASINDMYRAAGKDAEAGIN